ncbi:MAG: helix-hairpin-helix domain-containing protein [Pseudomonadota bacterium]
MILSYSINKANIPESENSLTVYKDKDETCIEVLGEVITPGIYNLNEGATISDAIKRAGGLKKSLIIDKSYKDFRLKNGGKITIQKITANRVRVKIERMEAHKLIIFSIPLDINTANQQDLLALPGIGPKTALSIIKHRDKNKGFSSIEELKEVKGIGKARYKRVKKMLEIVDAGNLIIGN